MLLSTRLHPFQVLVLSVILYAADTKLLEAVYILRVTNFVLLLLLSLSSLHASNRSWRSDMLPAW